MPSKSLIAMDSRCASQCEGSNTTARVDVRDNEGTSERMQQFLEQKPRDEPFNGLMTYQTKKSSKTEEDKGARANL